MSQMMIHTQGEEERLVLWDPEAEETGYEASDPREIPSPQWHQRGEIVAWIKDQGGGHRLTSLSGSGIRRDPETGEEDHNGKIWEIDGPSDDAFVAALKIRFW